MDLIINKVRELEHVDIAHGHRHVKVLTRAAVPKVHLTQILMEAHTLPDTLTNLID